jgi:parallel beta-helix repeat protein
MSVLSQSIEGGGLMHRLFCTTLCAALASAAVLVVSGGQAFANHVQCGDVITQDTRLDSDLIDCPGNGVTIGAANIRLDLAGHTVDGSGSGTGVDNTGGYDGVKIENGSIKDFGSGVFLNGAAGNQLRELVLSNGSAGIVLANSVESRVEKNSTSDYGSWGLVLFVSNRNRIEKNSFTNSSFRGAYGLQLLDSDGNAIEKNFASHSFAAAFDIFAGSDDNNVDKNTGSDSFFGLSVQDADRNILTKNVVSLATDGIFLDNRSEGTLISANEAFQNSDDGIHVEDAAATLTRNTANDNGDLGIEAVPGVTDGGGNRATGNGNPAQCVNVSCRTG